ncbi:MAG: DUF2207 domain-containing protein [Ruminococcus sp.]|nr:DUF2207 domain-containing protein [Ruminococcus sp.]
MNNKYKKLLNRIFLCLTVCVMSVSFMGINASAETKEEIYDSHAELDPFTDPEKFAEKFGLTAEGSFDPKEYDYFYYNYSSKIDVSDDNTIDVTEFIDVYFRDAKNGITRTLPLYNEVARSNGTHNMNNVKITGIYSDSPLSTKESENDLTITLGNEGTIYKGFKQFRLHYTYELGRDPLTNCDEFYFSILSRDLGRPVLRCQFEINMPKPFDTDKAGFYYGDFGKVKDSIITYSSDGQLIKGETLYHLETGDALTCRIILPEGYFGNAKNIYDYSSLISLGATTLMVIILGAIYLLSRRRNSFNKTLEYFPPKELNSIEAAYLKFGKINDRQAVSVLPSLAAKGYFSITELSKGLGMKSRASTGYAFTQKKAPVGLKPNEKMFIEGMFGKARKGKNAEDEPERTVYDEGLRDSFYHTVDRIKEYPSDKTSSCSTFFSKGGNRIREIYLVIMYILSLVGVALPVCFNGEHTLAGFDLFRFIIIAALIAGGLFITNFFGKIVKLAVSAINIGFAIYTLSFYSVTVYAASIASVTALIALVVMNIVFGDVKKIRTPYGKTLYAKLVGFERFLKESDETRLKYLADEYPEYFYDALSYSLALGVYKDWDDALRLSSFKEYPEWFSSTDDSSYLESMKFSDLDYALTAITDDLTYRPAGTKNSGLFPRINWLFDR